MTETPFPLKWPAGRPRRRAGDRKPGRFHNGSSLFHGELTVAIAMKRLQQELERIDARYAVVTSNLDLRRDGLPRSGARDPDDPGIAVYFQLDGKPVCMPCDTYTKAAQNIAAVAAHIEATRKIERHGVATTAEMFSGFVSLPPAHRHWRVVLGFADTISVPERSAIEARFRHLARERHPDRGGSHADMAEINRARDEALAELGRN